VPQVRDGGVAEQDLHQQQPDRDGRRQETVAPDVGVLGAQLPDTLGQRTIRQRLTPQPCQNRSDDDRHPWPPVQLVTSTPPF
jgi:hypothetical protein